MFEKSQAAITNLSAAVAEDVNQSVALAKAVAIPAIAGVFGTLAGLALKAKTNVETGEAFKAPEKPKAKDAPVAPLPTEEQNNAIKSLRALGKTDDQIAEALGIATLTVKMSY